MKDIAFIVGTGRSGTNLCRRLLQLHPQLKPVQETHFIRTLVRHFQNQELSPQHYYEIIRDHFSSDGSKRWIEYHYCERTAYEDTFKKLFLSYCEDNGCRNIEELTKAFFTCCYGEGDYILIDKTPTYGLHMQDILSVFPNAKFIHTIRDGRFASPSMQKHLGFVKIINAGFPDRIDEYSYQGIQTTFSTAPISLSDCMAYWEKIILLMKREAEKIPLDRYLPVYYEDLVLKPTQELTRMIDFIGVRHESAAARNAIAVTDPLRLYKQQKKMSREIYEELTRQSEQTLKMFGFSVAAYPHQGWKWVLSMWLKAGRHRGAWLFRQVRGLRGLKQAWRVLSKNAPTIEKKQA